MLQENNKTLSEKLEKCRTLIEDVSENKKRDQDNRNIARKNNTFFDAYIKIFIPCLQSYLIALKFGQIEFSEYAVREMKYRIEYVKNTFENKMSYMR